MQHAILLGLLMSVTVGCVADRLTSKHHEVLQAAPSVMFIHQEPVPFEVLTESNMFPMQPGLPGLLTIAIRGTHTPKGDGQILRSAITITDPSEQVMRNIAAYVSERTALKNTRIVDVVQPAGDLSTELRPPPGSQVFSFRTLMWALMHYKFDTSFHYLMFTGEGRLIDTTTGDTLWRSTCNYIEDAPRMNRPSLEDYIADSGKRLETELARATHACTDQLKSHLNRQ